MKIRTVYFKVKNMDGARDFWHALLAVAPHKVGAWYSEFRLDNINLGLVFIEGDEEWSGANCVPVFELADADLPTYIDRAKSLGASVIIDGLEDQNLKSFVMADLWGNEFELSRFHD